MKSARRRLRRGIVMFAALALMAVVALLVLGAVSTSNMVQRNSRLARSGAVLASDADFALTLALSNPDSFALANLELGRPATFTIAVPGALGAHTSLSATRLPNGILWLIGDAALAAPDSGRRRFNLVLRFPLAGPPVPASIVARGNVRVSHDVVFLRDTSVDAECDRLNSPDVVVGAGASVSRTGTGSDTLATAINSVAGDSAQYYLSAYQLRLLDSGGRAVHVRGDTVIGGGSLSGALIASGAVTITGPFRLNGVIVAGGRISAVAGGLSVSGALLSFAPPAADPSVDIAGATVMFSPCGVSRALRLAAPPRVVPKRSWAEIF